MIAVRPHRDLHPVTPVDASDRHTGASDGAESVSYLRDATDRIVARTGDQSVRYGYNGPTDTASRIHHGLGFLAVETQESLLGGVLRSTGGTQGESYSYPNTHGDVMATADATGAKMGPPTPTTPTATLWGLWPTTPPVRPTTPGWDLTSACSNTTAT